VSAVGHIRTQPPPLDLSIATGRAGRDQRPARVFSSLAAVVQQRLAERTMMAADEHIVRMRQAAAELPVT